MGAEEVSKGYPMVTVASTGDVQGGRQRSPRMTEGKLVPYLRVANVFDGYIDFSDVNEMTFRPHEIDRFRLQKGDILLNEGQSFDLVGRCAMFTDGPEDCCYQNTLIRYRAGPNTDPSFALHLFRFCQSLGIFSKIAVKTNSIAHLGVSRFAELKLPFPPYQTQVKINEVLEQWDIAIQKTERLILKKLQFRDFLSKTLLGPTAWRNSKPLRADQLFDTISEKNAPELPLLAVTQDQGVIPRTMLHRRISMSASNPANFKVVRENDFVISLRSFQGGLEHSAYEGLVSPAYTVLRCRPELEPRFYRHYLKSPDFIRRLSVAVIGIRDGKQISFRDFASIKLPLPPREQQLKIARLLDESEKEIKLLKRQALLLQKQKRGLMQKLLTGQWRPSVEEVR